jgi:hypothetical protein
MSWRGIGANAPKEMLFQQEILADGDDPQSAVDQIDHVRAAGGVRFARDPFVGANRDLGGGGGRSRTRKPLAPDALMLDRSFDGLGFDGGERHRVCGDRAARERATGRSVHPGRSNRALSDFRFQVRDHLIDGRFWRRLTRQHLLEVREHRG